MHEASIGQTVTNYFRQWGFQTFKYFVYTALAVNVYLFFREEWLASKVVFAAGISLDTIIEAFSSTIDTAAWLVLLLLFELETYVLDDDKLVGTTKRLLHGVRMFCYIFILYALYGYLTKVGLLGQFTLTQVTDLCTLSKAWTYMDTLNVYDPFTSETCRALSTANTEFYVHDKYQVITSASKLTDVKMLAWVDVINSAAWVSVVLMLEIDVRTQLGTISNAMWNKYNKYIKVTVYTILLLAAIFWGVTGNFIEFWDAFLWLLAFALIERNVFEWQAEVADRKNSQKD